MGRILNKDINLFKFKKFLKRFSGPIASPGRIFTLNHDVCMERLFCNESHYVNFSMPFIEKPLNCVEGNKLTILTDYEKMLSVKIESKKYEYETYIGHLNPLEASMIEYIKLHGSFNWKGEKDELLIVLGDKKEIDIRGNTLFFEYYRLFEKVLSQNPKILCIGYGFNDEHINSLFAKYDVEIQVINPLSSDQFYESLVGESKFVKIPNFLKTDFEKNKRIIWRKRIKNYYEADLSRLFPVNVTKSDILQRLEQSFFDDV